MWAIIGGSGFEKFDGFEVLERLDSKTPYGESSSGLCKAQAFGQSFLFLSRHGAHHELLPSEINHKANIYALKKNGAKAIISISATGSLRQELAPGDVVVPSQYIDRTKKNIEQTSFLGKGLVGHLSMAEPIDLKIFPILKNIFSDIHFKAHFKKTYICIEGPNFSTKAESLMYRSWGADIIGMTNFPEYALAKEANLLYVPLSFVTDYDCWKEDEKHVTLEQVIAIMKENNKKAFSLIDKIMNCSELSEIFLDYRSGLPSGLMISQSELDSENKKRLNILSS